jgi:hypothetical protein
MSSKSNSQKSAFSVLMHDTLDDVSTILSIAQYCLIFKEMSPEVRTDMERIVETGRNMSNKLKQMGQVVQDEK